MIYTKQRYEKVCPHCNIHFKGRLNKIYCSDYCRNETSKNKTRSYLIELSTGKKGAIGELLVAVQLIKDGFEVFRALSPDASADIIAVKDNKIFKIQVRTATYYERKDGIKVLLFSSKKKKDEYLIAITPSDNKVHYIDELK